MVVCTIQNVASASEFSDLLSSVADPRSFSEVKFEDGVLVLTDDNFDWEVAKYLNMLVEFYAPWCDHCITLAPEYAAAAQELAEGESGFVLAKIDDTESSLKLAARFDVESFPTIFWFKAGVKQAYTGGRTKDTIIQWIEKNSGPQAAHDEL